MPQPNASIQQHLAEATRVLKSASIGSAKLDAELLLAHVIKRDRAWLAAHGDELLTNPQVKSYQNLVSRRAGRTPLTHLTGYREFYGLKFKVTPAVLTPRTETEVMIDWVLELAPKATTLLDVGTGCGAIAIAVCHHRPEIQVTAVDVSPAALEIAKINAQRHQVNLKLLQSDLFSQIRAQFAVICANLPYLPNDSDLMPEVKKEPKVALLGGQDGLDLYRRFFATVRQYLQPDGLVFVESDPWQQAQLTELAHDAGLNLIREDYFILGFSAASATFPKP